MKKEVLLNPGPVNLSEHVRKALLKPDLCHREPEFIELQNSIRGKLLEVYDLDPGEYAAVLLTGSGTAALEAMLTSLLPADGKLLIIENGVYGERITRVAEIYRMAHQTIRHDWLQGIDTGALQKTLSKNDFSHIAVIHHETTTGRLNNLSDIATVCADTGVELLVDGVSSFGAEELKFREWRIAACAATANKCLHGVPGASFVIVKRSALDNKKIKSRNLYLDLANYLQQQDANGTPFTQSVQCFYALDEALNEFFDTGGRQARQELYQKRMHIVRHGLKDAGIRPLLEETECSCVLNAFHLPENTPYEYLHDELKKAGFVIYAGQGELAKKLFRISCMGDITEEELERLISVFDAIK